MPSVDILREVNVKRSGRLIQLEGMFDVSLGDRLRNEWHVDMPLEERDWNIGLIVGPSGSGKSTILSEVFDYQEPDFEWDYERSILDCFPKEMTTKDIVMLLSSIGFSSPVSWAQPYWSLSNGEQFRVDLARSLAETQDVCVLDEFTSVVDRTVAKVGSAAVAKFIKRSNRKLVAASCHYDIVEWLTPDWVYDTGEGRFEWRCLQRPSIELEIVRTPHSTWELFKKHHYLSANLNSTSTCFLALWEDKPAGFASAISQPLNSNNRVPMWREHRTVVLPDFQGVSIGNHLSDLVASLYAAKGMRYVSVTSNPAMIMHRARSKNWDMRRSGSSTPKSGNKTIKWDTSSQRLTASFEYVGPSCDPKYDCLLDGFLTGRKRFDIVSDRPVQEKLF